MIVCKKCHAELQPSEPWCLMCERDCQCLSLICDCRARVAAPDIGPCVDLCQAVGCGHFRDTHSEDGVCQHWGCKCRWFSRGQHDWEGSMCLGCGATRPSAFERVQRVAKEELAGGKNCFELALESCQSLEARLQLRQLGVMLGALDP